MLSVAAAVSHVLKRSFGGLRRWALWIGFRCYGRKVVTPGLRHWLKHHSNSFGPVSSPLHLRDAPVQPFVDLLNRPAGGDAYCGGPIFTDINRDWPLRHYRGNEAIDRPLFDMAESDHTQSYIDSRLFWCGPLAFHFGHQIADFGSRVLISSLDPREGELLWIPWKTSLKLHELQLWQQQLLLYLNPGKKPLRLVDEPLIVRELVVWPQQARMRSAPSLMHLEALSWCERILPTGSSKGTIYVARSRFAPCVSSESLRGAFAGEKCLVEILEDRGVKVIYPEELSLFQQLQHYRDSDNLIFAEGSAQHCLELLGPNHKKNVVIICRRPQMPGMELPLKARFVNLHIVEAVSELWVAKNGVSWNGLAVLDWVSVAEAINPFLSLPLTRSDLRALACKAREQVEMLCSSVPMTST